MKLASLLHDSDDKKSFKKDLNNSNKNALLILQKTLNPNDPNYDVIIEETLYMI
jgi:hypothetical protein